MPEENSFWKWKDSNFKGFVTFLESYCIPSCITHQPLPTCQFHWNRRNFLWTDGRTYVRTFETGFIRLTLSKSRPENTTKLNLGQTIPSTGSNISSPHNSMRLVTAAVWNSHSSCELSTAPSVEETDRVQCIVGLCCIQTGSWHDAGRMLTREKLRHSVSSSSSSSTAIQWVVMSANQTAVFRDVVTTD